MKMNLVRVHRNLLAVFAHTLKLYNPFNQGKQGIVPAASHIVTGMDLCTALTIDDVAGLYNLTTEFFTSESLTV
jgi:hypothetical protein